MTVATKRPFEMTAEVVDADVLDRAARRFADNGIVLPTFAQLVDPTSAPADVRESLGTVEPDAADARNLFRVNWYNAHDRQSTVDVPGHIVVPPELTGVEATIVLAYGYRFPMIRAHKVLAAYACLVPRVVTGQFDPTSQRAVWPSTGNYARGGVAISRIMGCRGVAVLPEGMSKARFDWLDRWVADPADIIRTVGTESNVKEIYDACARLEQEPDTVILNQFSEYANHIGHRVVTGDALATVYEHVASALPGARLRAYVSASGSAGTLAAGDHLKDRYGSRIVVAEALECPTLLENGYGEHNIQGIGDKHVPLIHNVMSTDYVSAISDRSTDALDLLFNSPAGHDELRRQGVPEATIGELTHLGYSSICNALSAIKLARYEGYGAEDVIVTVATDGSELYDAERAEYTATHYPDGFGAVDAAAVFAEHLAAVDTDAFLSLREADRRRIFNLGYYTWVEQQGESVEDFDRRRDQAFWSSLLDLVEPWDERIREFNERTGSLAG
ncbi:MAG: pyridoxal-phosphate dependent enzyme [Actinomycetota bacterium]